MQTHDCLQRHRGRSSLGLHRLSTRSRSQCAQSGGQVAEVRTFTPAEHQRDRLCVCWCTALRV
eukprot:scaffold90303_cov68-Phaeocystis_antarctica.AAC.2